MSLEPYGSVLDLRILRESNTGTNMGTGYAILSVPKDDDRIFPLSHHLPWYELDEGLHAFIHYLCSLNFNIMAFQETHTITDHVNFIDVQFQTSKPLWTRHCGLLSFSSNHQLSDNLIPSNPRIILSKISHSQNFYASFHVLVVYPPASTIKNRRFFFILC